MKSFVNIVRELIFNKKMLLMFFLGFSCGLPLALTASTLSAWLTDSGISRVSIGMFSLVGVPYSIKFLWAPILDVFKIPKLTSKLGRRRSWLLISQILLMLSIFLLATSNPIENIARVAILAVVTSFLSATQDILVDAYRIEYLSSEEQGMGSSFYIYGYRTAMVVSGGMAIAMAEHLSWIKIYSIMASLLLIGMAATLLGSEKNFYSNKTQQINYVNLVKNTIVGPFSDFMKKPGWLILLALILFYKLTDATAGTMTTNFLMDKGYSKLEIGTWVKTMALPAVMIGTFIAGIITYRVNLLTAMLIGAIFQTISNLGFVLLDIFPKSTELLAITMFIESLCAGLSNTMLLVFSSSLCNNPNFTASQFALLSSLSSIGRTTISAPSGYLAEAVGWTNFFIITMLVSIPSFILIGIWYKKYHAGFLVKKTK